MPSGPSGAARAVCWVAVSAGVAFGLSAVACGGSDTGGEKPVSVLFVSPDLDRQYGDLRRAFELGDTQARIEMESKLQEFRKKPTEPELVRWVDAHLAWVALERGDLAKAEELATAVEAGSPGVVRHVASVVRGAALRRRGEPKWALSVLSPLVNRVIDGYVRELLNREVVEAALAAERWGDAVRYMDAWLRDAKDAEVPAIRARIEQGLATATREPLLTALETLLERERKDLDRSRDVTELVAGRLADIATEDGDEVLAQSLLDNARELLGDRGEQIAKLAVGQEAARFDASTVGLLLSEDPENARRSVSVATGVAAGLALPGGPARLVSRQALSERESLRRSLVALASLGAAVVIAVVDDEGAEIAGDLADELALSVMLIDPRPSPKPSPWVFEVGVTPTAFVEAAQKTLGEDVAFLTDGPLSAERSGILVLPCSGTGPAALGDLDAALLQGGPTCEVAASSLSIGHTVIAGPALPPTTGSYHVAAGLYPLPGSGALPSAMATFEEQRGNVPSWYAGLGHDAAQLAWAALERARQEIVPQGTEEQKIKEGRKLVRGALLRAERTLWTTEASGFGGRQALPRKLEVRRTD